MSTKKSADLAHQQAHEAAVKLVDLVQQSALERINAMTELFRAISVGAENPGGFCLETLADLGASIAAEVRDSLDVCAGRAGAELNALLQDFPAETQ